MRICPDCGMLEALEAVGASESLKTDVLDAIAEEREGLINE